MTVLSPDRILQGTTTSGLGAYVLVPATAAFRNYSDGYLNGAVVPYCATDNQLGFEVGFGTLVTGTPDQINRGTVVLSSNLNSYVNWTGTTKQIFAWDAGTTSYVATFSTTYSVVTADWGSTFAFTGVSTGTFSLPALSAVPFGFTVTVKNSGTASCNVSPHTGNQIENYGVSVSFPLNLRASATLSSDGTVWRVIGAGGDTLSSNTDIAISSAASHDFLTYNSGTVKWVNSGHASATSFLDAMVGDTGSGGTKGLAPAPGAGDAAAGKFLKSDGTYAVPAGASGITALTSDVTATGPGSVAATIAANAVTNAKAAQMAAHTFKGNNTGSTANAVDLTATQLTAELNAVVGDSGSGGTKGLVPAPAAGDAAAGKFFKADGTFAVPPGAGTGTPATIHAVASGSSDSLTAPTTTRTHIVWNSSSGLAKSQTIPDPTLYDGYDVDVFDFFGDSGSQAITVTPAGTGTITVASLGTVANVALQSAYGNLSFRAIAALNTWIVT